jgi:hypothetical protein
MGCGGMGFGCKRGRVWGAVKEGEGSNNMLNKQATDRHMAYSVAVTRLATALVDSVGEFNRTYLKTVVAGIALYALLPRQVIHAMITKQSWRLHRRRHCQAESSPLYPVYVVVRFGRLSG